jgi:hypothetical protein
MTTNVNVTAMSSTDKIGDAMLRAVPKLPGETGAALKAMLTPQNLAIMAGVIVVWAGSHVVGIGAIVDVILLGAGVFVLGWSVFDGAEELYSFAKVAVSAKSETDLETASDHFAKAVTLLGLAVIQAVLLRGQARPVAETFGKGAAGFKPQARIKLPPPPQSNSGLQLSRPAQIRSASRTLGDTDAFGRIRIGRFHPKTAAPIPISKQRELLYHELVHRYFSPKIGPLLKLRAEVRISGYQRLAFLKYLEEALAQGYAMFRMHGLEDAFAAYRFPIDHGYVTVSKLASEGTMVGTIMLAGTKFYVSMTSGNISTDEIEISQPATNGSLSPSSSAR